jgi:transposase
MAKPYSYDFRQKVIQAVELDGLKKGEACELFNISRNTLNLWFQRRAETGDIQPKARQPSHKNQKIIDWDNFREFANANSDKTQAEMAQLWEAEISARTISRALSKINFTRKKKLMGIGSEMRVNEQLFSNN